MASDDAGQHISASHTRTSINRPCIGLVHIGSQQPSQGCTFEPNGRMPSLVQHRLYWRHLCHDIAQSHRVDDGQSFATYHAHSRALVSCKRLACPNAHRPQAWTAPCFHATLGPSASHSVDSKRKNYPIQRRAFDGHAVIGRAQLQRFRSDGKLRGCRLWRCRTAAAHH